MIRLALWVAAFACIPCFAAAQQPDSIVVPAVRGDASAGTITLRFLRFPATAAAPGAPIVLLAGGPGDAGTRMVAGMPPQLLAELRALGDVIAFDQRGTGTSDPQGLRCPPGELAPRDRAGHPDSLLALMLPSVRACIDAAAARGVRIDGLNTAESADDLEALRRAFGAEQLRFIAGSYGTHLALAAVRRHPHLVERMVLAGVEGPDHTLKLPSRTDTVLARVSRAKRPSLLEEIATLRTRLAEEPARYAFPAGQVIVLGAWDLERWIAESLDNVPEIDAVVGALPALLSGDFAELARATLRARLPRQLDLMNLAMDCASYASPEQLALIRAEAPQAILGDVINFPLPALCDAVGLSRLPDDFRASLHSDVRALLRSGHARRAHTGGKRRGGGAHAAPRTDSRDRGRSAWALRCTWGHGSAAGVPAGVAAGLPDGEGSPDRIKAISPDYLSAPSPAL